jgi:hypothetical protein
MRFACVCYRDPISSDGDVHDRFEFARDPTDLEEWLKSIRAYGGGVIASEDFVGAVEELNRLAWAEESQKAVFWIADSAAHGRKYGGKNNHREKLLQPLISGLAERGIHFFSFALKRDAAKTFRIFREFYNEIDEYLTFELVDKFDPVKAGQKLGELNSETIGMTLKTSLLGFGAKLIHDLLFPPTEAIPEPLKITPQEPVLSPDSESLCVEAADE